MACAWRSIFSSTRLCASERIDPVARAEALLKKIRQAGASEAAVQQFVCKHAGEHWEEFYEALFGYESKVMARRDWGRLGAARTQRQGRPRPAAPDVRGMARSDHRMDRRPPGRPPRKRATAGTSKPSKRANYRATGSPSNRRQEKGARGRDVASSCTPPTSAQRRRTKLLDVTAPAADGRSPNARREGCRRRSDEAAQTPVLDDEGLEGFEHQSYFQRRYGGWAGFFLGPAVRLVLGAALLAGGVLWAKQNNLLPTREAATLVSGRVAQDIDPLSEGAIRKASQFPSASPTPATPRTTRALRVSFLSPALTHWVDGWYAAIAGVVLVLSAFSKAPKLGLFLVPAAVLMLFGPHFLPRLAGVPPQWGSVVLGLLIAAVGFQWTKD